MTRPINPMTFVRSPGAAARLLAIGFEDMDEMFQRHAEENGEPFALYPPELPVDDGPCGTCGLPHPCCGLDFSGLPAFDSPTLAVQAADALHAEREAEELL